MVAIDDRADFGPERRTKLRQMLAFVCGLAAAMGDRQIADPFRTGNGDRRPRVDLGVQAVAQRVFGERQHGSVEKKRHRVYHPVPFACV